MCYLSERILCPRSQQPCSSLISVRGNRNKQARQTSYANSRDRQGVDKTGVTFNLNCIEHLNNIQRSRGRCKSVPRDILWGPAERKQSHQPQRWLQAFDGRKYHLSADQDRWLNFIRSGSCPGAHLGPDFEPLLLHVLAEPLHLLLGAVEYHHVTPLELLATLEQRDRPSVSKEISKERKNYTVYTHFVNTRK